MSDTKFDDHLFANNPFRDNLRSLKKSGLAQQGSSGRDAMLKAKELKRRKKHGDPAFDAECDIFLQAMEGMTVVHKDKAEDDAFFVEQMSQGLAEGRRKAATRDDRAVTQAQAKPAPQKSREQNRAQVRAGKSGGETRKQVVRDSRAVSQTASLSAGTSASPKADMSADMSMEELLQQGMHADEFAKAMAGVTPLTKAGRDVVPPVEPKPFAGTSGNALQDFMDGKLEFAISFTDEYMEGFVVGLDPVMMQKLRQGSFSPEAHVDLHGLNTQQAFETLRGFFKGSWYRGLRCVIVVCGRGKNSPDGIGILREKLQLWFTQEPFKRVILALCTAKSHDGGAGAVYVLMRKYKKKGHIAWERMPADEDLL